MEFKIVNKKQTNKESSKQETNKQTKKIVNKKQTNNIKGNDMHPIISSLFVLKEGGCVKVLRYPSKTSK